MSLAELVLVRDVSIMIQKYSELLALIDSSRLLGFQVKVSVTTD